MQMQLGVNKPEICSYLHMAYEMKKLLNIHLQLLALPPCCLFANKQHNHPFLENQVTFILYQNIHLLDRTFSYIQRENQCFRKICLFSHISQPTQFFIILHNSPPVEKSVPVLIVRPYILPESSGSLKEAPLDYSPST